MQSNVAVILDGAIETSEAMTANAILHVFGGRPLVGKAWPAREDLGRYCRRAVAESLRLEPAAAVVDRDRVEPARVGVDHGR